MVDFATNEECAILKGEVEHRSIDGPDPMRTGLTHVNTQVNTSHTTACEVCSDRPPSASGTVSEDSLDVLRRQTRERCHGTTDRTGAPSKLVIEGLLIEADPDLD